MNQRNVLWTRSVPSATNEQAIRTLLAPYYVEGKNWPDIFLDLCEDMAGAGNGLNLKGRRAGKQKNFALGLIMAIGLMLMGWKLCTCAGLPGYVSKCPVTPAAPSINPVATPAPVPPASALCAFPMTVSSPLAGATVQSPVQLAVTAHSASPIYNTRVYVDNVPVFFTFLGTITQSLWMANGNHRIDVVSEDQSGYISRKSVDVNVTGQGPGISQIQNLPGWVNCSSVLVTGAVCAAGLGVAKSELVQNQTAPTIHGGTSAKFALEGATHPYSNALYWIPLGGGDNVKHFVYDLYFYIDNSNASQALEFDVNQTFGTTRWTWGSECNFDADQKWDIWNDAGGVWVPTNVPCTHFPSHSWIHLVWTLERVGNLVHYVSLQVNDQTYDVDTYYTAQQNWYADEIDIAFQMDGNWEQEPYNVWLDHVTLEAR